MIRVDPSPILFYFYFFIRSESIRVDPTRTGGPDFCTCLKMFVCPVPKISHVNTQHKLGGCVLVPRTQL